MSLHDRGFTHAPADPQATGTAGVFAPAFQALIRREIAQLEPDVIIDQAGSGRYRRHSKALLFVEDGELRVMTPKNGVMIYNQGEYNTELPNARRELHVLSADLLTAPALQALVWHDFGQTRWDGYDLSLPLCVGFSMIRFFIAADAKAESAIGATPDALHQDGEVYTFAHLLERDNAEGAGNIIAPPHCAGQHPRSVSPRDILADFTLNEYFDSYAIFDPKVSHYVSALRRQRDGQAAARTVLLVDFTPMKLIHQ